MTSSDETPSSGDTFHVTSHDQIGGVTAGQYINQAPQPSVSVERVVRDQRRSDGTYESQVFIAVEAPYAIGRMQVQVHAPSVQEVSLSGPPQFFGYATGHGAGFKFAACDRPPAALVAHIITTEPDEFFDIRFGVS